MYPGLKAGQVRLLACVVDYQYDLAGNLTSVTDPIGTTKYVYDPLNRPIEVIEADPDGSGGPLLALVSYRTYDQMSRFTAEVDPRGAIQRYKYEDHGNVSKVIATLGVTTQYFYDHAGQLTAVTDPEGRTTGYTYDDAGRLTAVRLPGLENNPTTYQYDTAGNTRFVVDGTRAVGRRSVVAP